MLASDEDDTDIKLSDFGFAKLFANDLSDDDDYDNESETGHASQSLNRMSIVSRPPYSFSPRGNVALTRPRTFTSCGTDYYVGKRWPCEF